MRKNYSKIVINFTLCVIFMLSLSDLKGNNSLNFNDIAPPCNQPDVPTVMAGTNALCLGSSTLLVITSGNLNDAANWTWHTDSANGQMVGTGDTLFVLPNKTTTYFVRGEGNCVGTSATAQSVTITVNLIPTLSAFATPSTLCAGNNITLTASGSGKITWNKNVTNGAPFFAADSATYVVTSTDTNSGCAQSTSFFIGYLPPAPVAVNSNTCVGAQNVNPNVTALNGFTLKWYDSAVGGNVSIIPPVVPTNVAKSYTYYASQIATTTSSTSNSNGASYAYQGTAQGQTFQIPGSGILTSINVSISTWFGAADSTYYTMKVYDSIGGNLLATASNQFSTPPSNSWTYTGGNFDFTAAGLNVIPGNSYYFEVSSSGSSFLMYASYSDNYAQGQGYVNGSAITGLDFVFTATAAQFGCEGPRDTVTVTVHNVPQITATASADTICMGSSVTLTGQGGQSYSWTNNVQNATPFTPYDSATYIVTGTDSVGCSSTAAVFVAVKHSPSLSVSSSNNSLCAGNTIALTATSDGKYSWNNNIVNGVPFTPTDSATYVVTAIDTLTGCANVASVYVAQLPPAPTASNIATCIGVQGLNPAVTGLNGYTLNWYPSLNGGVASTTTPIVPTDSAKSLTYYVSQLLINNYSSGNSVGESYAYPGTVQGQTFVMPVTSSLNYISVSICTWIGAADTTTYTMKLYDAVGGNLLATATNTLSTPPSTDWTYTGGNFNFPSTTLIAGKTYYFEITSSGSQFFIYASYSNNYNGGDMYINGNLQTGADITFTANANQYGCESSRDSAVVNVYYNPAVKVTASATQICAGTPVTLTAAATIANSPSVNYAGGVENFAIASQFNWNNNVVNGSAFMPTDSATYVVTAIDTLTGCSSTAQVFVQVNSLPTLSINTSAFPLCAGSSTTLTANTNASKLTWVPAIENGVPFTPADSATYTATAIDTVSGCAQSSSVFVAALPPVPTASNLNACLGGQGLAPQVAGLNGYTLNWYTSATGGIASTTTPIVPTDSAKSYTFYVSQLLISNYSTGNSTGGGFGYAGTAEGQTFVMPVTSSLNYISVNISTWFGATDTTIYTMNLYDAVGGNLLATAINTMSTPPSNDWTYTGGNFNFSPISLIGGNTYYFEVTSSNSQFLLYASYSNNYTSGDMYINGNLQTGADVTFTANATAVGCESARDSAVVNVYYNPVAKITASATQVCAGTPVVLTASDAGGNGYGVAAPGRVEQYAVANKFTWYSPYYQSTLINGQSFVPTSSGMYYLNATDSLTGCSILSNVDSLQITYDSVYVAVNPMPDNSVVVTDSSLTVGQMGAQYTWVDCNNAYAPIVGDTNQVFKILNEGNYSAIINLNGCVDTTSCQLVINTGINKVASQAGAELYPNPNTGMFTFKTSQLGIYKVVNELGQVVQTINVTSDDQVIIHLDNAKAGLYYLVSTNNSFNQVFSVVK